MNEPFCFLDTNIFIRHLTNDIESQSRVAQRLFEAIEQEDISAETSVTVIFETIYVMSGQYKADRETLAGALISLLKPDGIIVPSKHQVIKALELWSRTQRLSFADAYHLVLTSTLPHQTIASFDKGMDNCLPGVVRIEQFP